jgi:hypothetical protein
MGRAWCGEAFDPVARKMKKLDIPRGDRADVLEVLIRALQANDWDTEGESLEELKGDPAVVEAFRRCGVIIKCDAETAVGGASYWCEREKGKRGHADGQHEDGDVKWPVTA